MHNSDSHAFACRTDAYINNLIINRFSFGKITKKKHSIENAQITLAQLLITRKLRANASVE